MPLRTRMLLVFAALIVIVAACGAAVGATTQNRDGFQRAEAIAQLQTARTVLITTAFVDQQVGEHGYSLTGDRSFLEPYRRGRADARRELERLEHVATLRPAVAAVRAAGGRWQRLAAQQLIAVDVGQTPTEVIAARAASIRRFDRLQIALRRLRVQATADVESARSDYGQARSFLLVVSAASFVLIGVSLALAAWALQRWLIRPVSALGAWVRNVRVGEANAPLPEGPAEVAWLAGEVDAMRRRIASQAEDAIRVQENITQHAEVLLALRSELGSTVGDLPLGWSAAADLRAAEGIVAGDCYDVTVLPGGGIGLIVVDISGHGAVAGVLALRCKELLRSGLGLGLDPGSAITTVASQLGDLGRETFFSAFAAVVDTERGTVQYANAGHPPAFVVGDDRDDELGPTGPIVGPFPGPWSTLECPIGPGDRLCVYTDGIIEARNHAREQMGPDRLRALLAVAEHEDVEAIVERCLDATVRFTDGRLRDDATIAVICRAAA